MQQTNIRSHQWLTTMDAASRYRISSDSLRQWRRWKGFPDDACKREGIACYWDVAAIDPWLRSRPVYRHGPRPQWLDVVVA